MCVCVCVCVCVSVSVYIYIYIYTHTHTHAYNTECHPPELTDRFSPANQLNLFHWSASKRFNPYAIRSHIQKK